MIFVHTAQHTGTWFLLDFLKGHREVPEVLVAREFFNVQHYLHNKSVVHIHIRLGNKKIMREFNKDKPFAYAGVDMCKAFLKVFPTISSLRDPLLSIITRNKRHPDLDHSYLVYSFLYLIENRRHMYFVPVDTDISIENKEALIRGLCAYCGIQYDNYSKEYADKWKPRNTTGQHEFKKMYKNRNLKGLQPVFGKYINLLKEHVNTLRPFLEEYGYKNLIWWD